MPARTPRFDGKCRICTIEPRRHSNGLCKGCDSTYRHELRARRHEVAPLVSMRKRWTPQENKRLAAAWGKYPPIDLMKQFGRSYDSLRVQAAKLGVRSSWRGGLKHKFDNEFGCTCANTVGKCWSADDVAQLTLLYQTKKPAEIAKLLGRTKGAVMLKASRLGIHRVDHYANEEAA